MWHTESLDVSHVHCGRLTFFKALCRDVLEIGILARSRLEKGMMIIWRLRERTIEHRTLKGRSLKIWNKSANGILGPLQGHTHEPCWTDFLIARHGEELTRVGLEAVLELIAKVLSRKDRRVERVVDYEGGVEVWEGLRFVSVFESFGKPRRTRWPTAPSRRLKHGQGCVDCTHLKTVVSNRRQIDGIDDVDDDGN